MGLFVLLAALAETINETVKEKIEYTRAEKERREYENIDFNNIDYVTFDGTEPAYRIETEEEYDPVRTWNLTEMNGAPCYGTRTVEYEVEDGENYCFTIRYNDDTEIYRKFHETSPLTEKLLKHSEENNSNKEEELLKHLQNAITQENVDAQGIKVSNKHLTISNYGNEVTNEIIYPDDNCKVPLMCPHCKAKIPQESVYCCYCGKKI